MPNGRYPTPDGQLREILAILCFLAPLVVGLSNDGGASWVQVESYTHDASLGDFPGWVANEIHIAEFVVPKSMPITFPIIIPPSLIFLLLPV